MHDLNDFFVALMLIWGAFLYIVMVWQEKGWFRFISCFFLAYAAAVYLPLLALGPAFTAFFKDIRDRLTGRV